MLYLGSRPHGWSPLTLLCVSSCSQDWVLHPGTSRPSPRTGFPLTVIQNPDLLVPELPLRAWGHPKTADGCWVARPSLLTRLDEGRVACLSKLQGQPHTVRVSGVRAEGQVHAVLPPSVSGAPGHGPSCCCCWLLGQPQPSGHSLAWPPRCHPAHHAALGQGPGQAAGQVGKVSVVLCWSGSVVTVVPTSWVPTGSTTHLPALSRSPQRRAQGSIRQGVQRGPGTRAPERWVRGARAGTQAHFSPSRSG